MACRVGGIRITYFMVMVQYLVDKPPHEESVSINVTVAVTAVEMSFLVRFSYLAWNYFKFLDEFVMHALNFHKLFSSMGKYSNTVLLSETVENI